MIAFHEGVVDVELGSATDNPVVISADGDLLHGGNFFGQHVAYASDALALAVVNLAVHAERAIARTCDPLRNRGVPDNQDVVPMGTIAARKCDRLLELASLVLAIEAMVLADAFDLRSDGTGGAAAFSSASRELVAWVRERVPRLDGDRPLTREIDALASLLDGRSWDVLAQH